MIEPEVSVIIPAYNAEATLRQQLEALVGQTYLGPFEVLVVDNGSRDGTGAVAESFADSTPPVRVISAATQRGSAHARNVGATAAVGKALAFCDADDVVAPGWLEALTRGLTEGHIIYGTLRVNEINEAHVVGWRPKPHAVTPGTGGFAPSGNMAIMRSTYLDLGGMREDYPKAHDVEFSRRAVQLGVSLVPAPDAVVHYRYRSTAIGVIRQGFRSGRARVQLERQFGDDQSDGRAGATVRAYWWLLSRMPFLLSKRRRGLWLNTFGARLGAASAQLTRSQSGRST